MDTTRRPEQLIPNKIHPILNALKNTFMNKKIIFSFFCFLLSIAVYSQADSIAVKKDDKGKKPVKEPWGCTMLVDAQTSAIPLKGSLELYVQHRFSPVMNGIKDIFGIYGASNIRLALGYSITDRLSVGFGTEKDKKYQELFLKGKILEQNRDNSIPLSLTFFGNTCLNAREKAYWGNDYKFADRMSYFAQLIVARKFCNAFSFEIAPSWVHVNKVEGIKVTDSINIDSVHTSYKGLFMNDALGATIGARIRFYNNMSILLEYDQGFYTKVAKQWQVFPMPNAALALEIGTGTHCFQVFASTYKGLIPQQNLLFNQMDVRKLKDLMIGFNITVRLR
jgi:hypothetical protein